jgi:hypothetical protein
MGMAFDGHTVVVFEGHPSALVAGCARSTLLIVDQAIVEHLQPDWVSLSVWAMTAPNILMFNRDGSLTWIAKGTPSSAAARRPPPSRKQRWWWPFGGGA